jgi:p-cumate 2,3-dioxygenase subunit beta
MNNNATSTTPTTITRADVEDLLFREAELLDNWELNEWLAMYTDDAAYYVPSADLPRDADPEHSLFYIADDRIRLQERVIRLMKKGAHSEYPRSRTRHLVSNVQIKKVEGDEVMATAAFVTFRSKNGNTDTYMGSTQYRLRNTDGKLRIREKRCTLDIEALRPHGRVSIIL